MTNHKDHLEHCDVTVIIPFRNRGLSRLRRAIGSLRDAAPGIRLEIIVSDFGSDDAPAVGEACTVAGATWVRTESDHWNKSICVNKALAASHGKYVQIHDVDMIWAPGSLARHVQDIEARPQSFINSQVWDLPEDLAGYALITDEPDWELFRARSASHSRWGHGLVLAPRAALLRVGGLDERMHTYGGEDLDLTKRLKKAGLRQEWAGHSGDELFHIWHERIPAAAATDKRVAEAIEKNRSLYYNDATMVRNVGTRGETEEPLVSVVIATQNRRHYLAEAIYSALYQTVRDLEVVVVDDGSTDDTQEVVRAIDDPRVRYVRQEAAGVAAARNRGTREARGFYIAVLDDDDLMRPDRLEIQLRCLDGEAHGCVGNLLHFYDSTGEVYYFSDAQPTPTGALPMGGFAGHPSWLLERTLLEQIPYDESLTSAVDNNVALRALRSGFRFLHCNRFLTLRRLHDGQVTAVDSPRQKLGARLTHVWFRGGVDGGIAESTRKVFGGTVQRADNAAESAAALRPWLPDHLVSRTVHLQPGDIVEESGLPLPHRSESAVSIVSATGEQIGTPMEVSGVTWSQLAELRRLGVVHEVTESEPVAAGSRHGLALAAPQEPAGTNTPANPREALDAAAEDLIAAERDKLEPHEFLVCWEPAEENEASGDVQDPEATHEVAGFSLTNSAGTYRLALQRCSDFGEVLAAVERADGLVRAYSPTARLHLAYIQQRATEMGMSA